MKELYTAPALELLNLAAEERLASTEETKAVDFDSLLEKGNATDAVVSKTTIDIDIPIDLIL